MTRKKRNILLISLGIPLLLILYILFLFNWNILKGFAQNAASSSTGRQIKINGDINVMFGFDFSPLVTMKNVTVTNMTTGTEPNMVQADELDFEFNLLSAFKKRMEFPLVRIENARILLEKDKEGNANWLFGKKEQSDTPAPRINKLMIKNTHLTYRDLLAGTDFSVVANNTTDFRNISGSNIQDDFINLTGDGDYKKNKFNINYIGASVINLESKQRPYPVKVHLKIGSTEVNAEGSIVDPFEMQGMDINFNVKGATASDIFPIFGIALPPTPPYDVTGKLDLVNGDWHFNNFKGHMGSSDLSGDLTWSKKGERPLLTAKFISNTLNFKDLGALVGGKPSVKSGQATSKEQQQKIAHLDESPYFIPDTPLDISRLSAMDAKVEFTGKKVVSDSNLPLDDFYLNVDLENSLMKIQPVKFGTANGDISANMEINARQKPVVIDGLFEFRKLSLARLLAPLSKKLESKNYNEGYIGGAAKLKGYGTSLRQMVSSANGTIGIGMEGGQLSNLLVELAGLDVAESLGFFLSGDKPTPVRCIIGDFNVKNGMMTSNAIVADTDDTKIDGKGTINLANEKMDIRLDPKPKDPSILSLRSPIYIAGTLKHPDVNIGSKELIIRGAAAAAASVVLTPFVGALAFIEPGLGKDSNCAKLIAKTKSDMSKNGNAGLIPKNKDTSIHKKDDPASAPK